MNAPSHKAGDAVAPQPRASAGETAIRDLLGGCTKVKLDTTGFPGGRSRSRTPDCTRTDPETGGLEIHEVKTGVPIWTEDLIDECLKDAWSLTPAGRAVHGQNITKVHWHFVAHSRHNSVGIHPPLLQCLKDNNIPFTIHAPTDA